jgi:hypothetical protein
VNFDKLNTGFTILPSGTNPVRALTLISAENYPQRNPSSFVLEGSLDGVSFQRIASNAVPAFPGRNTIQNFPVENTNPFNFYRVRFPTVADEASANAMQIAEVELHPRREITSSHDAISITTLPVGAVQVRSVTGLIDRDLGATAKLEVANITFGDPVVVMLEPACGDSILKGFELIGAADDLIFPGRRPSSVAIFGTSDGVNFIPLASVTPAAPSSNHQIQEFAVNNDATFGRYAIVLGAPVSGDRLQVGELRLFGEVAAPPALSIRASGGNVQVSWLHAAGFELIHKATLNDTTWLPVGIPPVLNSGTNTVTIPMNVTTGFFRLRK